VTKDAFNLLLGIVYYIVVIIGVLGTSYSYLKTLTITASIIAALENQASDVPHLSIIVIIINYSKYVTIPALIWGLWWYNLYAGVTIKL